MLVAEPIITENNHTDQDASGKAQRYLCLDLLNATFECTPSIQDNNAILVEVWPCGGLLHLDRAVPDDCATILQGSALRTRIRTVSCKKDEDGYVVEFTVLAGQPWFPESYFPPYLLPAPPRQ